MGIDPSLTTHEADTYSMGLCGSLNHCLPPVKLTITQVMNNTCVIYVSSNSITSKMLDN